MSGGVFRDNDPETVRLPFGGGSIPFPLAPGMKTIETRSAPPLSDPSREVEKTLQNPISSPSLQNVARGRKSACIVVSDMTRPVPNKTILPPVIAALNRAGITGDKITVLIATGMHEPTPPELFEELYGEAAVRSCRIVNHDARDTSSLTTVGLLSGGVPLEINSHYVKADLKILTGLIEPHRLAGFSGGGKAVVPGISGINLMRAMHSYDMVEKIGDGLGVIEGNPFREAVDQVLGIVGADFAVNVTINRERALSGVFAGSPDEVFLKGAAFALSTGIMTLDGLCDTAVTTGGGAPSDATLYQAVKGIVAVAPMVKPGGTLLMAAECSGGLGSAGFAEVLRNSGSAEGFRRIYSDPARFTTDQWAVQAVYNSTAHLARILVYSPNLEEKDLALLGIGKCADFHGIAAKIVRPGSTVFVVPEGPHAAVIGGPGAGTTPGGLENGA